MSDLGKRRGRIWGLWAVIFLLLMVRNCAFGFSYWPQLDDYIQLHNYAKTPTFSQLQQAVGVLGSRPLAGLADYFIWAPLFDYMILGVAVISAAYALCVVWMKGLLERYVTIGPMFPVIMALLPLGIEGTYWMSASTRVVIGLLCACLSTKAFAWWLDRGGWWRGLLFALLLLLPFGFYEQSAVLAMTMAMGMGLLEWKRHGRRVFLALWAIPAIGLYGCLTTWFSNGGVYSARAAFMLPNTIYYWSVFLPELLSQLSAAWLKGGFYTVFNGFVRGVRAILSGQLLLWALPTVLLCGLYGWMHMGAGQSKPTRPNRAIFLPIIGLILFLAPLAPFFIFENPWFSLRGTVTSFAGLALLCDGLFMAVWQRGLPWKQRGPVVGAAVAALLFCVAGAVDIGDYQATTYNDQRIAGAVIDTLRADFPADRAIADIRVGILNVEASYLPDQTFRWHEHIHGCTESSWAFTGLLSYLNQGTSLPSITPLPSNPIYRRWNAASNRPDGFDVLYYYNSTSNTLTHVTRNALGDGRDQILTEDGAVLGTIWEDEEGIGYLLPVVD